MGIGEGDPDLVLGGTYGGSCDACREWIPHLDELATNETRLSLTIAD